MEDLNVYYITYITKGSYHGRMVTTELDLDSSEGLLQWIEDEEKVQGKEIVPIFLKKLDQ